MPKGGALFVTNEKDGEKTVIKIKDTGCGMPKDVIQKVFDPFFTTKEQGTGLGLSIVKSKVEESGGELSVDSDVGKGTTFRIKF